MNIYIDLTEIIILILGGKGVRSPWVGWEGQEGMWKRAKLSCFIVGSQ